LGAIVGVVTALASVLLIATSGLRAVGIALLTLAPFMPFLLVQDFWRWAGFMHKRPGRALANDAVFNTVQLAALAAFILAGRRNASVAIVAWGLGAAAGSWFGLRQFHVRPQVHGARAMVASRWHQSRWLFATGVSGWAGTQGYPFIAGPIVGSTGLGGLKAAQSLVTGPSVVLLQAGGSVGLPEAAHGLEQQGPARLVRVARRVTLATSLSVGLVAAVILVAAPQLLGWVYGHAFVHYATSARILAVAWLITAFTMGPVIILKVTKNARALFNISVTNTILLIVSIVTLSVPFGVDGTAWATLLAALCNWLVLLRGRSIALRVYQASSARESQSGSFATL
jgi:O-antigen/teichoic acid export membrane protein